MNVTGYKPITICIIKPDVKEKRAEIIKKIKDKGYEIVESKEVTFTAEQAREFYKNQANTVIFNTKNFDFQSSIFS